MNEKAFWIAYLRFLAYCGLLGYIACATDKWSYDTTEARNYSAALMLLGIVFLAAELLNAETK